MTKPVPSTDAAAARPQAWRSCLGGWSPLEPPTLPRAAAEGQFWAATTWQMVISPAVTAAHSATRRRCLGALLAADRELDERLGCAADLSRQAGAAILRRFSPVRGDKFWRAYAAEVAAGRSPGHPAALIACRAAVFHFPLLAALEVVLAVEFRGAGILPSDPRFGRWMDLVIHRLPDESALRAA